MKHQIDLNLKNSENLPELINLIQSIGINSAGIVNKDKNVDNLKIAKEILQIDSNFKLMSHFSIQYHYNRDLQIIKSDFLSYSQKARNLGIEDILIISGSAQRKNTSLELLNSLEDDLEINLAVAYNPYFPDQTAENERFKVKLKNQNVKKVYFQIGEDLKKLKDGIDFASSQNSEIEIWSCLLIPNKTFQRNFRFRPWSGVNLSERFLNNLEYANMRTREIYDILKIEDVNVFFEVSPFGERNIELIGDFIK